LRPLYEDIGVVLFLLPFLAVLFLTAAFFTGAFLAIIFLAVDFFVSAFFWHILIN